MRPTGPIVLFTNGKIQILKDDNDDFIAKVFASEKQMPVVHRASYVYPTNTFKRLVFKMTRKLFGDKGKMSDWTRRWNGPWYADMIPFKGPKIGTFKTREDAIKQKKIGSGKIKVFKYGEKKT